ncbi:hypothetical protein ACWKWJ_14510 [Sphingopyxis terrae subsp. ummariensis]
MRNFDNSELGPDEFAFRLAGNHAIDVGRFLAFIECLRWTSGGGAMPQYDLAIVEFAKGSIFGRLRVIWQDNPTTERLDRMQAELQFLQQANDNYARRGVEAAERQAAAAEDANTIARSNRNWTAVGALSAVAMLVLTIGACVKSEKPNPCSDAAADLMEQDSIARLTFWSRDCSVVIDKGDVPEMQRREQGIRASRGHSSVGMTLPFSGAGSGNNMAGHLAEDATQAPDNDEGFPGSTQLPLTDDDPRQRPRGVDGAREAGPISILSLTDGIKGLRTSQTGVIGAIGDLLAMEPEPGNPQSRPTIVVPPASYIATNGDEVEVRGKLFRLPGLQDLMIADTIIKTTKRDR